MSLERALEDQKSYTIGQVSRLLDVKEHTIRFWEKEFPMIVPVRTTSGRREYSKKDFAILQKIKKLLYEEGYTTKGALKELQSQVDDREMPEVKIQKDNNSALFYESPLDPTFSEEQELMEEKIDHVKASNQSSSKGLDTVRSRASAIEKQVDSVLWKKMYQNLTRVIQVLEDE